MVMWGIDSLVFLAAENEYEIVFRIFCVIGLRVKKYCSNLSKISTNRQIDVQIEFLRT